MAARSFSINTTPHEAVIGDTKLLLLPEVLGAEFADAYSLLKEAQQAVKDAGDNVGGDELRAINEGMREFINGFLLEESKADFESLKLPDRVLVQLLEYVAELYGGGTKKAGKKVGPGGSPSAS